MGKSGYLTSIAAAKIANFADYIRLPLFKLAELVEKN